ncbi:hypothetical protein ACHAXT_001722 [Thalassiosira profunda]
MNKFLTLGSKSKKAKERAKQQEARREENDFLYGRSKRTLPALGSSRDDLSVHSLGSTGALGSSNPIAQRTLSHEGYGARNDSRNTTYSRGDSDQAVRGTRTGHVRFSAPNGPERTGRASGIERGLQDSLGDTASRRWLRGDTKHSEIGGSSSSGGRKSSGMTGRTALAASMGAADAQRADPSEDRPRSSVMHQPTHEGHEDHLDEDDQSEERRRSRQQKKERKHRKSDRKSERKSRSKRLDGDDDGERKHRHSSRKHDGDDDGERKHRHSHRRRHRESADKKTKEEIRSELRKSAISHRDRNGSDDDNSELRSRHSQDKEEEIPRGIQDEVDAELEDRRRRQREQEEEDQKLKDSIRQQRDAARELRSSGIADSVFPRPLPAAGRNSGTFGSIDEKREYEGEVDPFEAALQLEGGLVPSTQNEDGQAAMHQNLIDMHIAQFRATSKTSDQDGEEEYEEAAEGAGAVGTLDDFVDAEVQKNVSRRLSRRISATTLKINAWQQKYSLKKALELAERTPEQEWASSFYRCDPRWQIMRFFDEVAREGGEASMDENLAASPLASLFKKANVFTVWRPTSDEAIRNMMLGNATGKGLDIKGKSAKRGNISSYVPFIQIYEEPHKEHVRAYIKDGRVVRVFYQSWEARNEAHEMILDIRDFMLFAAQDAMRVLSDEFADEAEQELAMKHLMYDDKNISVEEVNTYVDSRVPVFGLDITERLFWESYVMTQDCARPAGTDWDIGRQSELTFQDMNFKAIRHDPAPGEPRAVVYQMSKTHPMEPRMLLMAYEEYGRVKPVVSDFDCFLLGSRGVKYNHPIPPDQMELVQWSVKNISDVLDEKVASESDAGWMETWFKVLKKAAIKGYYPKTPKYGNGDPKSYEIIEVAVSRLQETGCVRHGAECFNWFFPQEIDDELLVISDTLPGNVKWKKVNVQELQDLLITKIDEGFTFPINPKWVLCDPGWRRVYDKLLASQKPNVQDSINCWLPPGTGLRAEIDAISEKHPLGFEGKFARRKMDLYLMEDELERYYKVQRAWRKLRLLLYWMRYVREKQRDREERLSRASSSDAC